LISLDRHCRSFAGRFTAATLADLAAGLGANREAALCRELTKLHEEVKRTSPEASYFD
jgi:16S rRNA C1402 (ribose-2'-O) methylase RsmI